MEEKKPIVTLGQAYEAGWRVNARCAHGKRRGMKQMPECYENAELDLESPIWMQTAMVDRTTLLMNRSNNF